MHKRVVSIFIALVMLITISAGCGKNKTPTNVTTQTVPKTSVKSPAPSGTHFDETMPIQTETPDLPIDNSFTPAPKVTPDPIEGPGDPIIDLDKGIDLQGRDVHFKGHYAVINDYLRAPTGDSTNGIDILYNDIQTVQDKFNFKFVFEPVVATDWRVIDDFNIKASSGFDWADVIWNESRMAFPVQVVRNLVVPIDTVYDFWNDPVYNTRYLRSCAEWEGRVYGLGSHATEPPNHGVFYNADIIKNMSMTDPIDLYNRGEWTWETFFDMAVGATADLNGDGIIDQYGLNGDARNVYQSLMTSNGSEVVEYTGNGEYQLAFEKPAALKALVKTSEILKVLKIVKPETFMDSGADQSFVNGKALFMMGGLFDNIGGMKLAVPNFRWMSLPRGPDAGGTNLNIISETKFFAWTTTIGNDWKQVVRATSWLFTTGYDWERYPDRVNAATLKDKQAWIVAKQAEGTFDLKNVEHIAGIMFDQGIVVNKWPAWSSITDKIITTVLTDINNGEPVASAIDAHRSDLNAELNATLNKSY